MSEISIDLTDEQKALSEQARKFFMEVWRPAAIALDKLPDPQEVITEGSLFWDAFRKARQLGYHTMAFPQAFGGMELEAMSFILVAEQMGYAAADLAVSFGASSNPFTYAMMSKEPSLQELAKKYCRDGQAELIGCWAITEPDHGSDWLMYDVESAKDPKCAPSVRAVADGADYIINGQKSAWVTNGSIATHANLFFTTDPTKGMEASAFAIVPLNLPGVSRGKPLDKIGQRALNQAEIFFDGVRIPKSFVISSEETGDFKSMMNQRLASANAGMGVLFSGCAHSAYDEALSFAKERVQGGKTIIHHQNIKLKLFDMFIQVEAARSLARRVMLYNSKLGREGKLMELQYSIASKIFATETAFRVASQAIQIFGGSGLSREYHIEKIFRDARAAMIEDGVNESLALGGAERL